MSRLDQFLWNFPIVRVARRNLSRSRTRTGLAILGIVIGVVAISSLGIFGTTFTAAQLENLSEFGSDVQVMAGQDNQDDGLTAEHIREIERVTTGVGIVPIKQETVSIQNRGMDGRIVMYGVDDPTDLYSVSSGRLPDSFRNGVLIGVGTAETYSLEPGDSVVIDGERTRVLAVLEDEGQGAVARSRDAVIAPAEAIDSTVYQQVVVTTDSVEESNESAVAIRAALNERKEVVTVFERAQVADLIDESMNQINTFLIGIGAISLLVAGVSILNVMLMSVMERRKEIGVLRAVGFQRLDVLRIILSEAIVLGFAGSVIGVVLSILVGMLINNALLGDPMAFQPGAVNYVVIGFSFGVGASILSGIYPAWKAAREEPVEALRN